MDERPSRLRPFLSYGLALFITAIAFLLTLLLPGIFEPNPFLLFFAAAALSAWYGGLGPGLLASILSLLLVRLLLARSSTPLVVSADDLGRIVALLVITGVVSLLHRQYQRTLKSLRRSRDQLDIYLRDMANGITVQDRSGKLIYANYEAAKLMGFASAESLINASGDDLLERFEIFDEFGERFPASSLPGRLALLGMHYPEAMLRYHFKDTGREQWSYTKARPLFDEKGQVQAAISLFLDITEVKQAQQALAAQREQLRVTLRSIGDAVIATDLGRQDHVRQSAGVHHDRLGRNQRPRETDHRDRADRAGAEPSSAGRPGHAGAERPHSAAPDRSAAAGVAGWSRIPD